MSKKFTAEEDIQALSQRNLQSLMKTLSNKTTQKSVEALAKIDKEEWSSIAETASNLRDIVQLGGFGAVFDSMINNITDIITLKIDELMSPITNEVTEAINDILNPFLLKLTPVINNLTNFFIENPTGTGVGGIAGGVIGAFLGSPAIGALLGASLGAALEEYFKWVDTIIPDVTREGTYLGYSQWARRPENKTGVFLPTYAEYLKWLTIPPPVDSYAPGGVGTRYGRSGGR